MASSSSVLSAFPVPVFIDSTLETHLAMLVPSGATVAFLKSMIEMEHAVTFPDIGDIIVKAVKVKRKGSLYHMSDSMLVNSVFRRVKGTLFLQIEAVPAPPSKGLISTERNVEKQNFGRLTGKNSGENFVLDKSQPSSELGGFNVEMTSNHLTPVDNLRNEKDGSIPSESDALAKPGAQIASKTDQNKDSKKINTATIHVMSPLEKKKKRKTEASSQKEKSRGLEDNSVHAKQTLSENLVAGDTKKQTNESIIPLNQSNTDLIINHGDANPSANQVANNVEMKKGKSTKVHAEKKDSMDENLGGKRRRKEIVPQKNLVTNGTNLIISSSTEANGAVTVKPDATIESNQDGGTGTGKRVRPDANIESNQDGGTRTGTTTETKNVKSRKRGSKKDQVSQEATQTTEVVVTPEKNKAKKAKVSASSEVPPVRETEFIAGEDSLDLERDPVIPQNPAAKEVLLNEIDTYKDAGSPEKPRSDKTVSAKGLKGKPLVENASPYKTRSKKSKAASSDVAAQDDSSAREHESFKDRYINPGLKKDISVNNGHVYPYMTRPKKSKAAIADMATKDEMLARENVFGEDHGSGASLEREISANDVGQIISSILTDLKEQGPPAPESEDNEDILSESLANVDEATNQSNPNLEPEPFAETRKTRAKSKIVSVDKNEISQNTASSLNGEPVIGSAEKRKPKNAKAFSPPLLSGNESENTSKLETLVVVGSSQQENERNQPQLDSNFFEDPSKQEKKKERREHEVKSTVQKGSGEMVNNTLKGSDEIAKTQMDATSTDTMKPPQRKFSRLKSKEKSVNIDKGNIETTEIISNENNNNVSSAETEANRSTVVHNLDTGKINFVDYFGHGSRNQPSNEPKQSKESKNRLKGPNPSTEDENDAQNEAKRYKVAVRKVPVKRNGEKNRKNLVATASGTSYNDNASESIRDEGSFMSDGITSARSGGTDKRDCAVVPSQLSSGVKKLFSDEKANAQSEDSQHVDIAYEREEEDPTL